MKLPDGPGPAFHALGLTGERFLTGLCGQPHPSNSMHSIIRQRVRGIERMHRQSGNSVDVLARKFFLFIERLRLSGRMRETKNDSAGLTARRLLWILKAGAMQVGIMKNKENGFPLYLQAKEYLLDQIKRMKL